MISTTKELAEEISCIIVDYKKASSPIFVDGEQFKTTIAVDLFRLLTDKKISTSEQKSNVNAAEQLAQFLLDTVERARKVVK